MGRVWNRSPRRIVIFRALKLGDMLCAVPAFRAIRRAFPAAEVVLVGLPWAREFVDRYRALLDGFREFPGYPGLPEREPEIDRIPAFFERVQAERFDLAIQLHGSGSISNRVTAQFGARTTAGFSEPGCDCPDPAMFLPYPGHGLELRRLLRLVEHLGAPSCGESLEFPIRAEDYLSARRLDEVSGLKAQGYVCIHPGASATERRWPLERFAVVGDALAARGFSILLTGTSGEADLTAALSRVMRSHAIDLAGRTTLGTLAAVLADARMLVCNDTGVSHLADALRVPSVVISTGDHPERWAPADRHRHRVLCHDEGVSPDEVIAEAEDLLIHGPPARAVGSSSDRGQEGQRRDCDLRGRLEG